MKSVTFLRTASVLTIILAVLHTIGGVFGKAETGAQQLALSAMKANRFTMMGLTRSYWDFQRGLGLAVSVFLLVEAIVFWQLGTLAKNSTMNLRPVMISFFAGYVGLVVISYEYIFAGPMVGELLIALSLVAAIVTSRSTETQTVHRSSSSLESIGAK